VVEARAPVRLLAVSDPRAARYASVHLDELERLPGPATLTWSAVRAHFDIRAFGTNAYTANEPGDDVVEPHTERADAPGGGHQELYFVARGRARFTLDGDTIDAPAGTYVFVRDPGVHRHAVAEEAGTTVLSFGGPPTFEPSAWEWSFAALAALDHGDGARARELIADGLRKHPESAGLHWALAAVRLAEDDRDGAIEALRATLERAPDAAAEIRADDRFAPLLGDPRFEELLAK
jgi:hypothetical protein